MTGFCDLLSSIAEDDGTFRLTISEDWLQGRTAYGGLSAALCTEAARRAVPDLPPLRSAQFAFIGPASGPLSMRAQVLRRGKSSVFVRAELTGEAGPATTALLGFAAARPSRIDHAALPMPEVKPASECEPFSLDRPAVNFLRHFENRIAGGARPMTPRAEPEYRIWFRHRDPGAHEGIVPLIALADAPPPAAMVLFPQNAPISTMTWALDVLSGVPTTEDGWWLVQSRAEAARDGYTTQAMTVWNARGEPVIAARQMVAIFI
jgi:acyl-CoA thioesterase